MRARDDLSLGHQRVLQTGSCCCSGIVVKRSCRIIFSDSRESAAILRLNAKLVREQNKVDAIVRVKGADDLAGYSAILPVTAVLS